MSSPLAATIACTSVGAERPELDRAGGRPRRRELAAVGRDAQGGVGRELGGDPPEQLDGRRVGPVQVLDDEQQRLDRARRRRAARRSRAGSRRARRSASASAACPSGRPSSGAMAPGSSPASVIAASWAVGRRRHGPARAGARATGRPGTAPCCGGATSTARRARRPRRSVSARTRRLLPMPASPGMWTMRRVPARRPPRPRQLARARPRGRTSASAAAPRRPRSGRPRRSAAAPGARRPARSTPLSACSPSGASSKWWPISACTASLITTAPGVASDCSRAATCGVVPMTARSIRAPPVPSSPATTTPLCRPTRACSSHVQARAQLLRARPRSPARRGSRAARRPRGPADSRSTRPARRPPTAPPSPRSAPPRASHSRWYAARSSR